MNDEQKFIKPRYIAIAVIVLLICPIIVGIIVSVPSFSFLTVEDNEWIGFWGNYFGSIFGAGIGGFVAYLIAKYEFNKHAIAEKEDKDKERKLESLYNEKTAIIKLRQSLRQHHGYAKQLNDLFIKAYENMPYAINDIRNIRIEYEPYRLDIINNRKLLMDLLAKYELYRDMNEFSVSKDDFSNLLEQYALNIITGVNAIMKETDAIVREEHWIKNEQLYDSRISQINTYYKNLHESFKRAIYEYYKSINRTGNIINQYRELPKVYVMTEEEFSKKYPDYY